VNTAWLNTPMQNEVYAFMKAKDRDVLDKLSIIDVRDEFEIAK
jgi:hypothetical protein